jgi:integrase
MRRRRESPIKRVNPSGKAVWVARYTARDGRRRVARPPSNRSKGTFARRHEAQEAIDWAYEQEEKGVPEMVGAYAETWIERHPRSPRTNRTNAGRVRQVLDVEVDGRPLRDWPFRELRRRHALELVGHMLEVQGRATTGAQNILRTLSAMTEDAITDEVGDLNWVRGVKVRTNDPRAQRQPRAARVLGFEQMHVFAAAAGPHEAAVRVISDCGLRLGELLGLERSDFDQDALSLRGSAHDGAFTPGDQPTKKHVRRIPCPPSTVELIRGVPARIDTALLFPTPSGRLWWERNFYRDVWYPAQEALAGVASTLPYAERRRLVAERGLDFRPHDFRHSWVTHLRAAGVDPADLAEVAGHTVETATARYTHALRRSDEHIRRIVG